MKLADEWLRELYDPSLTENQRVLLRCRVAADRTHAGQYEGARGALGVLWRGIGECPNVEGLEETTAAEVLLRCGALSGWLGTSKRAEGAQDAAKDLLSEAQRLFETHGLQAKVAEAEYELGMCYWRAGAFDDARVILRQGAGRLGEDDNELRAKILIRSTLVEISAGRYHDALNMLDEAAPVFNAAPDAFKGRLHGQRALVLRRLGTAEGRPDYFDRAIIEYTAAIVHFERAGHERYCGNAENNLAFLHYKLGRYGAAHAHLDRAQRIFRGLNDSGNLAQVRETRARVLLAEKRYEKAADSIGAAVGTLEKAGEPALLADALAVQATVEAKLGRHYLSLPTFRRAVEVAERAGALESAGAAALSLIETHGASRLSDRELCEAYSRADDLLKGTQDAEVLARLRDCARILARRFTEADAGAGASLTDTVTALEAKLVARALKDEGGSVSRAARRLGVSYQRLAYLLETRHADLMPARTPAKKRRRSIIKKK